MNEQLPLIEVPPVWKLDDHTRAVGREGVAKAREALRGSRRPDVRPRRAA